MDIFTKEHNDVRQKYGTENLAKYWFETLETKFLDENMIRFMESMNYLFFATTSKDGRVNMNFKGTQGQKLIKVLDKKRFIFPDFSGNGILHSIGDLQTNPYVGLLIIDFARDIRIKVNGKAKIIDDSKIITKYLDVFESFDIQRLIEVSIDYVIPNCSKNLSVVRDGILKVQNDKLS